MNYTSGGLRSRLDVEHDIRQLISRAVMADGKQRTAV
jgi:hypothetical protein